MTGVVIIGEYLDSTIEGTPYGLGGLKVNREGVHLCSGSGHCRASVSWEDIAGIDLEGEHDAVESSDVASRVAPIQRLVRLFAQRKPARPSDVRLTVNCHDGNVVVLLCRPGGGRGASGTVQDRLTPYLALIKQPAKRIRRPAGQSARPSSL